MSHNPLNDSSDDEYEHLDDDPALGHKAAAEMDDDEDSGLEESHERPSLVKAGLAGARTGATKVVGLSAAAASALAGRMPGMLNWLRENLGKAGGKSVEILKDAPSLFSAAKTKIQDLRGGQQAREEAALLAESSPEDEPGEDGTNARSSKRFKMAIAGSVLVLATAPFVARFRPGGTKETAPPLALAGPAGSEASEKQADAAKPKDEKKPAEEKKPEAVAETVPNPKPGSENEGDPFANDPSAPPSLGPEPAVIAAKEAEPPAVAAAVVPHEPPAIEAAAPVEAEVPVLAAIDPKGSEPPDPFGASPSLPEEKAATPIGLDEKVDPAPAEPVTQPGQPGLAGLPAVPTSPAVEAPAVAVPQADPPAGEPSNPVTTDVAATEPPVMPNPTLDPNIEPEPEESPLGLSNQNLPPDIKPTEPRIIVESEPPVPVEPEVAVKVPAVTPEPERKAAAPIAAAAAATGAAAAAVTVAALDRDPNQSPPKRVTSSPRSDTPSTAMAANTTPDRPVPAPTDPPVTLTPGSTQGGLPPQRVTSVPRSPQADSIRLDAPPVNSNTVASNSNQPRGSISVPEPADPSLFAPLERSRTGNSSRTQASSDTGVVGGRIEPITHVVARNENFWTISKHYYGSGRFYKALWRANSARVPRIDELYIGTSIRVPAPEDLDPRYIEPASGTTGTGTKAGTGTGTGTAPRRSSTGSGRNPGSASNPSGSRDDFGAPRDQALVRTGRDPDNSSSADPDDLFTSADDPATAKNGARASGGQNPRIRDNGGSAEFDELQPVRGRSASGTRKAPSSDDLPPEADLPAPRKRKGRTHIVKPYETLRSIAKQELGDSRREDELLELNSDLVEDPTELTVGTPLRLPAK